MIFPRKEVALKDGTKVVFKSPEVSDAQMLVNSIIKKLTECGAITE